MLHLRCFSQRDNESGVRIVDVSVKSGLFDAVDTRAAYGAAEDAWQQFARVVLLSTAAERKIKRIEK